MGTCRVVVGTAAVVAAGAWSGNLILAAAVPRSPATDLAICHPAQEGPPVGAPPRCRPPALRMASWRLTMPRCVCIFN